LKKFSTNHQGGGTAESSKIKKTNEGKPGRKGGESCKERGSVFRKQGLAAKKPNKTRVSRRRSGAPGRKGIQVGRAWGRNHRKSSGFGCKKPKMYSRLRGPQGCDRQAVQGNTGKLDVKTGMSEKFLNNKKKSAKESLRLWERSRGVFPASQNRRKA